MPHPSKTTRKKSPKPNKRPKKPQVPLDAKRTNLQEVARRGRLLRGMGGSNALLFQSDIIKKGWAIMKVFEGKDRQGNLTYFEIPNTFFGRKSLIKAIKKINGATIIAIAIKDDTFCTFKFGSKVFEIMEPFGDNSHFHISEEFAQNSKELIMLKDYFSTYRQ